MNSLDKCSLFIDTLSHNSKFAKFRFRCDGIRLNKEIEGHYSNVKRQTQRKKIERRLAIFHLYKNRRRASSDIFSHLIDWHYSCNRLQWIMLKNRFNGCMIHTRCIVHILFARFSRVSTISPGLKSSRGAILFIFLHWRGNLAEYFS